MKDGTKERKYEWMNEWKEGSEKRSQNKKKRECKNL